MTKVEYIVKHFWNPPPSDGTGPYTITLAQGSATTEIEMGGGLMQLSPPEYCWAPVVAIAKAIDDGVGDDVLPVYRTCI